MTQEESKKQDDTTIKSHNEYCLWYAEKYGLHPTKGVIKNLDLINEWQDDKSQQKNE